jgi:hypothetical protein
MANIKKKKKLILLKKIEKLRKELGWSEKKYLYNEYSVGAMENYISLLNHFLDIKRETGKTLDLGEVDYMSFD